MTNTILDRIIELREAESSGVPLSFSAISEQINQEFTGLDSTKDGVQKLYKKSRGDGEMWISRKVIAAGDFHGHPDLKLLQLILDENPDLFVAGGDLVDASQFSHFTRSAGEKIVTLEKESARVNKWLEAIRCHKILLTGNHEDHIRKTILASIPVSSRHMVDIKDPLEGCIEGLENCEISSMPLYAHMPNGTTKIKVTETKYMLQLGDVLLSHNNFTGEQATKKLMRWTDDHRAMFNWPHFRMLVQFHTHAVDKREVRNGHTVLVEPGMVGTPDSEAYKYQYNTKYQPGIIGAVVFTQKKERGRWITDLSSIKILRPYQ